MIKKTAQTLLLSFALTCLATVGLSAQDYCFESLCLPPAAAAEPVKVDEKTIIQVDGLPKLNLEITKIYQDQKRAEVATIFFEGLKQIQHLSKGKCKHVGCQKTRLAINSYVYLCLKQQLKTLKTTNPRYKLKNNLAIIFGIVPYVILATLINIVVIVVTSGIGGFLSIFITVGLLVLFIRLLVKEPKQRMLRDCCIKSDSDIVAFLKNCKGAFKKKYHHLRISLPDLNNPTKLNCVFASKIRRDKSLDLALYENVTPNEIALATPALQN